MRSDEEVIGEGGHEVLVLVLDECEELTEVSNVVELLSSDDEEEEEKSVVVGLAVRVLASSSMSDGQ